MRADVNEPRDLIVYCSLTLIIFQEKLGVGPNWARLTPNGGQI